MYDYEFINEIDSFYRNYQRPQPTLEVKAHWYSKLRCYSLQQIQQSLQKIEQNTEKLSPNINMATLIKNNVDTQGHRTVLNYGYCKSCASRGFFRVLALKPEHKNVYSFMCFCQDCQNYSNLTNRQGENIFSVKNPDIAIIEEHIQAKFLGWQIRGKLDFVTLDNTKINVPASIAQSTLVLQGKEG